MRQRKCPLWLCEILQWREFIVAFWNEDTESEALVGRLDLLADFLGFGESGEVDGGGFGDDVF